MKKSLITLTVLALASPSYGEDFYSAEFGLPSVFSSTTSDNNNFGDLWPVSNLLQGAGQGFGAEEPHSGQPTGPDFAWVTNDNAGFPADYIEDVTTPVIVFDFQQDVPLDEISVWAYSAVNSNGLSEFSLRFATSGEDPQDFDGGSIEFNPTFYPQNTFDGDAPLRQSFEFGRVITAQYVEMTMVDNFFLPPGDGTGGSVDAFYEGFLELPGGDRVGLNEVAFRIPHAPTGGVMVGNSSLIGGLDYSDSFTGTDDAGLPGRPYLAAGLPAYHIENNYGNPSTEFIHQPGSGFSIASDLGPGFVQGGAPAYPVRLGGNASGAGSNTGFTQTSGNNLGYGVAYAVRDGGFPNDEYVVQVDAIQVNDFVGITSSSMPGGGGHIFNRNSITVFFRGDGSGNASVFNGLTDTPIAGQTGHESFNTGIAAWNDAANGGESQWYNYAVRFDQPDNEIELFVGENSVAVIDLDTFAGGIYSAGFSNQFVGVSTSTGDRTWTDNFQVGTLGADPLVSDAGLLIEYRYETTGGGDVTNGASAAGQIDDTGSLPRIHAIGSGCSVVGFHYDADVPGGIESSFSLNFPSPESADHFVRIPITDGDAVSSLSTGDFRIETWFRTTDTGRSILVGSYAGPVTSLNLELHTSNRGRVFVQGPSETTDLNLTLPTDSRDGQWHHLAGVRRGNTVELYYDDALVGSTSDRAGSYTINKPEIFLGIDGRASGTPRFQGSLDNVRLYNSADTSSLVAEYLFETIEGAAVLDGQCGGDQVDESAGVGFFHGLVAGNPIYVADVPAAISAHSSYSFAVEEQGATVEYARIPVTPELADLTQGDFALETWFKSTDEGRGILVGGFQSGTYTVNLSLETDNRVRIYVGGPSVTELSRNAVAGINTRDGQWHHLVGQREGATVSLYLDGQFVDSVPDVAGAYSMQVPNLFLGRDRRIGSTQFDGQLDNTRIWKRALSASEISALAVGVDLGANIVLNTADSGTGSLRQVINDASSGEPITFAKTLAGQTIVLTSGQILINKNLAINASDLTGGIIIDGNANGRIFEIAGGNTVVFDSLTLTNGLANWAGAIYVNNPAELTLNNSTLSLNCTAVGGDGGGGIYNQGTVTLNSSTLSENSAYDVGGGIYNNGTLTLNNSTLSGNSVVGAGGGIYNDGTLTVSNSIVGGNTSSSGEPNISGSITGSNNLISNDPLLAPLGDYGGPTQTMPPRPGSLAIDMGGTTTLTSDQRGLPRIVGAGLDIGAYETGNAAGYAAWSAETLPPGGDLSFGGDADGDGTSNGLAYGIGPGGLPEIMLTPGGVEVGFGYRAEAEQDLIWTLVRSTDLQTYEQILRIEGGILIEAPDVMLSGAAPNYTLLDENPPPGSVFYRLGVELVGE